MPDINIDMENKVITVDFTEVEYKALSWVDKEPLAGVVDRIKRKVDFAISEAVKWEMNERLNDPDASIMPATREELIMQSTRPSLAEQADAIDENGSTISPGTRQYEPNV